MEGEPEHWNGKHSCVKCACCHPAGYGTDHLGWGFCHWHEKNRTPEYNAAMESAHRNVLISKNPGVYRDLNAYARSINQDLEESGEQLNVLDDLRLLRGAIQEVVSRGAGADDSADQLTEYVDGKLKPMSDKTRIDMMAKLLPKVNTFIRTEAKLREADSISLAQFRVWFGKFWSILEGLATDVGAGHVKEGAELLELFKNSMKELGDPRGIRDSAGERNRM